MLALSFHWGSRSARVRLCRMLPLGGSPDVSCMEIGRHRFAAAYEVLGALEDYAVAQAWARRWWVGVLVCGWMVMAGG